MQNNNMDNIVIIGSSGHAKVVIDIIEKQGKYTISGLIDYSRGIGEKTLGYAVLGKEEDLPVLIENYNIKGAIVAIGDNFTRSKVAECVERIAPTLKFVTAIHPAASVGVEVSIGEGSVLMAGAVVNSSSSIGRFCILNTNSSLDHDSELNDFASLAPSVTTGGNCRVGSYSAVGIGANLIHGIEIGKHTVIGAGSLVMKSIDSFVVAYGTPAKIVRKRESGDKYL